LGFAEQGSVSVETRGMFPCDLHFSHAAMLTDLEVFFDNDSKG
jgi:hypothetical protein